MGSFNGSGVFVRSYSWTQDAGNGIPITASRFDTEDSGFAGGLSNCITRDGQQILAADIPWNNHKITGLADATNPQDAVNLRLLTGGSIAVGSYPQTAAELAAGIVPVNYGYPPGDPRRNGYTSGDATTAINNAAVNGILILQGTYTVGNLVTLPNVLISASAGSVINGTGSVRGVLQNTLIPHALFQVPYNLVTQAERLPVSITGDYFIDPLLGHDSNNGTSAASAIATVSHALTLIAAVSGTASSLTIVLRSGRHETSAQTMTSSHTLTSGGKVNWVNNAGESPYITAPTKWFFRSSAISAISGNFTAVTNALAYAFVDLYDAETGQQVECANNMGSNWSLPRNQTTNCTLSGSSGSYKLALTLTAADVTAFNALSSTEKAGVQLRVTQDYTSSWHGGLTISSSFLTGTMSNAQEGGNALYYNGWATRAWDAFGAPYLLQNLKTSLNGTNFCAYSDNVWLPSKGTNYFTVDNSVSFLIDTGVAAKHYFSGIGFRYVAVPLASKQQFFLPPFISASMLIGEAGVSGATNCDFSYANIGGVQFCYSGGSYTYNTTHLTGLHGMSWSSAVNGADAVLVQKNTVRRWGHYSSICAIGIYTGGVSINVLDNDIRNGPWSALRIDSNQTLTTPTNATGTFSGNVQRNICMEVGYVDNSPADYIGAADQGVLSLWGGTNFGSYAVNYTIDQNVVGRGTAIANGYMRGIFGDGGCQGFTVTNNLVWGQNWNALMIYQVGTSTYNNVVNGNVLLGTIQFQSETGQSASQFGGNLVASTMSDVSTNILDPSPNITFPTANAFGIKCITTEMWPTIDIQDPAWNLAPGNAILPFIKSFLKQQTFISTAPSYETAAIQATAPITASTYTVNHWDHDLTFNRSAGTVTVTLPNSVTSPGREIYLRTTQAQTVVSAASNVTPLVGGSFGIAILAGTAGKWVRLVADGTNSGGWNIVAGN